MHVVLFSLKGKRRFNILWVKITSIWDNNAKLLAFLTQPTMLYFLQMMHTLWLLSWNSLSPHTLLFCLLKYANIVCISSLKKMLFKRSILSTYNTDQGCLINSKHVWYFLYLLFRKIKKPKVEKSTNWILYIL